MRPQSRVAGLVLALAIGCGGNASTRTMTENEFRQLPPFQGQVTAIQRLEWPQGFVPTSMSGPHFRMTIRRKDDGSTIVIDRVQTTLLSDRTVVLSLSYAEATFPTDLYTSESDRGTTRTPN
jgi:hypothetical protein